MTREFLTLMVVWLVVLALSLIAMRLSRGREKLFRRLSLLLLLVQTVWTIVVQCKADRNVNEEYQRKYEPTQEAVIATLDALKSNFDVPGPTLTALGPTQRAATWTALETTRQAQETATPTPAEN